MGFIKRAIDFVVRPTHSRTLGILIFFVLIAAVSLTVYVAQQQQQIRQRAADFCADTTINECPPEVGVIAGNTCVSPDFKCKITNGNKYKVYGCR